MKKKILSLCLVAALAATAIVGGTLAYFTDTEKATNTMAIGNVEIDIDEYQYNKTESKWETFEDEDFILYPIENAQGIYLYNKSVRTYNRSENEQAAYIRSFALIEKNTKLDDTYVNEGDCCFPGIHFTHDTNTKFTFSVDGTTQYGCKEAGHLSETVTVDGHEYWAVWFVVYDEKTAIPASAAMTSLHSISMDKNITQEQAEGWGEDGVQVIAFSQGIQSEGLDHAEAMEALGEVTVANLEKWINEAEVATING